jgi:uncharacterized protein (TIGR03435 family)
VKPVANDETGAGRLLREVMRNRRRPGEIPMTGPDRVQLENWPLLDLIAAAYSVRATQVSGPDWLSDQGFDIEAKLPDGTPKEELNAMLQSLLEERFGLKVHRATKTGQGFALTVGKNGPKLKPAEPRPAPVEGLTQEERMAQLQQKMQTNAAAERKQMEEKAAAVGAFDTQSWGSITMEELAAIRRSASGRRDRFDRKLQGHHRDFGECRRSRRHRLRRCRKTRPETGVAQGDRRNCGG